jgi:hypothetical protein
VNNYGISQNPDTKVYILVFNDKYLNYYCKKCGNKCMKDEYEWCKQCQIYQLKNNFINCTSGNERIDDFIQKMQLKINDCYDTIFEWIPYNEFMDTGKDSIVIWKKGSLYYNSNDKKYIRKSNKKVYLKHLHNSQDIEVLNEVLNFL